HRSSPPPPSAPHPHSPPSPAPLPALPLLSAQGHHAIVEWAARNWTLGPGARCDATGAGRRGVRTAYSAPPTQQGQPETKETGVFGVDELYGVKTSASPSLDIVSSPIICIQLSHVIQLSRRRICGEVSMCRVCKVSTQTAKSRTPEAGTNR
ncbi:hypothetical protein C8R45DRAFT_1175644, partial [Mycena sanguinolenta]